MSESIKGQEPQSGHPADRRWDLSRWAYRLTGAICCLGGLYLVWLAYEMWNSVMDDISRIVLCGGSVVGVFFCGYIGIRFLVSGRSF